MTKLRLILTVVMSFSAVLSGTLSAQSLTQSNFISVFTPQFLGSGNTTRLPVVFRAKLKSLSANTTYRYFNQAAAYTDLGSTNPGAGNPMLINSISSTYTYTTSPGLTTAGNFQTFTTNAAGEYTGWFAFVYTSNARFTAGSYVIPSIVIGNTSGTTQFRLALNDSIKVLAFSISSGSNNGTGIYGISNAASKDIIALFDNTSGTGKPLAITYLENISVLVASTVGYYTDSISGKNGRWGTIVPNNNSNGVRRIEEFSLSDGTSVNFNTVSDGIWPSANTINPAGGSATSTALRIDTASAPLPVEITYFNQFTIKNTVKLCWQTSRELNNSGFTIERKKETSAWSEIGFICGHGTVNTPVSYEFTDKFLPSGKYNYRIKQLDYNSNYEYFNLFEEVYVGKPSSPEALQNYPNPFNPVTSISFALSEDSYIRLYVYNITGEAVKNLIDGDLNAGYHSVNFNGEGLASGVYFYRIIAKNSAGDILFSKIKKMLLIK